MIVHGGERLAGSGVALVAMAVKVIVFAAARRLRMAPSANATATLLLAPEPRDLLPLQPKAGHQPLLPENERINVGLERGRGQ